MRSFYDMGQYSVALEHAKQSSFLNQNRNRLLFNLELGSIYDRLGETKKSRSYLLAADRLVDELYTISISQEALSFIYNDSASDYSGEDYEKVAIHTLLALSYIGSGELNEARVEARKINSKLQELNEHYESNKNQYGEDAFARYLAGTIYDARGEWDSAIIDYNRALNLYQGDFRKFITDGPPEQLVEALYRVYRIRGRKDKVAQLEKNFPRAVAEAKSLLEKTPDLAQIVVIHTPGKIAVKTAQEFFLPISGQVVRFSFPVIHSPGKFRYSSSVTLSPGNIHMRAENLANLSEIAHVTLEDRRLRMILKSGARLLAKGVVTEEAYRQFGLLGGLAANAYSAVTETADTRSWTLLPAAFDATRLWLKPGKYELTIRTDDRITQIKTVQLKPNEVKIFRD